MSNRIKNNHLKYSIRELNEKDISGAMQLKESAGWNQVEADWRTFLKLNPQGCFAAVSGEQVVGSGTCLNFDSRIGWIAMILVDPDFRRQGIGSAMMDQCVAHLASCQSIKLDATSQGRPLYAGLGFRDEFEINRYLLQAPEGFEFGNSENVSPIEKADLPQICELDGQAFGAARTDLMADLFERGPEFGFKYSVHDEIRGFILGRRGSRNAQLGPIVAERPEMAGALVSACLKNIREKQVVLDVPVSQASWLALLEKMEIAKQRWFMRMYKGEKISGKTELLKAITGPDFG